VDGWRQRSQCEAHDLERGHAEVAHDERRPDAAVDLVDLFNYAWLRMSEKDCAGESRRWLRASAEEHVEVARLVAAVRGRIIRLLRRHDIHLESRLDDERSDPLALDSPVLAHLQGASVLGRVATGPRAGQRVLRLGNDASGPPITTGGPRHAHSEGFDLIRGHFTNSSELPRRHSSSARRGGVPHTGGPLYPGPRAAGRVGGPVMGAEIRYAKSGEVHIAYRVFGNGPRDIVLVPGTVSHVELYWELPANAYLLKRLASFARVIVFDKRGQGLSDRGADQTLDERVGDVLAVMNAAGSARATIYGWSEGGQLSLKLAATHPERVSGLVLYGSYPSIDVPREQFEQFLQRLETHWGEGVLVGVNAPSRQKDEAFVQWFGRLERAVASPGAILALMRANYEIDVRHLLPSIAVPTLVLHREGDSLIPIASGRYLAEHIPGAKYVELPGVDHLLQALDHDLLDVLLDEVEEFVTGVPRRPRAERMPGTAVSADPVPSAEGLPPAPGGGQWQGAADAIAELARCREILASGEDGPGLAGLVARAEAVVAAARGSWSEAEAQFVKAAETFRRHGMVWQEA
jgi:pimeloyl-ACP methyl ester carboxylesterase